MRSNNAYPFLHVTALVDLLAAYSNRPELLRPLAEVLRGVGPNKRT
jgi:hypothetical protein